MFIINLLIMIANYTFIIQDGAGICQSKMHSRTSAYSIIMLYPPITFVNMDANNIDNVHNNILCTLYAAEQRNKCGWSCIAIRFYHQFYANAVMGEGPCSPLFGLVIRLVVIRLGDFTCLRPWVIPVPLWLEMVPMHSAYARPFII